MDQPGLLAPDPEGMRLGPLVGALEGGEPPAKREKWQLGGKVRLQRVWVWNDTVTAFVKGRLTGHSLNVCAGQNPLCSVNLDLDPQDRRIIRGDMRLLPFPANTFDVVVSDPPWKIAYYERFRPFFECIRVCKVGGTIIYNAYWIPMVPSGDAVETETWLRQDSNFTNTSVISVFRKVQDNPEYNAARQAELDAKLDQRALELRVPPLPYPPSELSLDEYLAREAKKVAKRTQRVRGRGRGRREDALGAVTHQQEPQPAPSAQVQPLESASNPGATAESPANPELSPALCPENRPISGQAV